VDAHDGFLGPVLDRAFAGEVVAVENQMVLLRRGRGELEERVFSASFSPVRDEAGAVGGVFHPLVEIAQALLAERQWGVLLRLSDAQRQLSGPLAILATAREALAQELAYGRAGHAEIDVDAGRFSILHEHRRENLPGAQGSGRIVDYGAQALRESEIQFRLMADAVPQMTGSPARPGAWGSSTASSPFASARPTSRSTPPPSPRGS
jgi:hypothetical protein